MIDREVEPVVFESQKNGIASLRRTLFCRTLGIKQSLSARSASVPSAKPSARKEKLLHTIVAHVVRRPGSIYPEPGALLMGCQVGLEPNTFADVTNDRWGRSTPMSRSPHVELLNSALRAGRPLTDEEIMSSRYWALAQDGIEIAGEFFGVSSDEDLLGVVRNFVDWGLGNSKRVMIAGGSGAKGSVLVARVPGSSKYQIIDGHHRVAVATVKGESTLRVSRTWLSTGVPDFAE
jgi:hypothetical protein